MKNLKANKTFVILNDWRMTKITKTKYDIFFIKNI